MGRLTLPFITVPAENCLFCKGLQLMNDMISCSFDTEGTIGKFKGEAKKYVRSKYESH